MTNRVSIESVRSQLRRAVRVAGFGSLTAGALAAYVGDERFRRVANETARRDAWVKAWATALLDLFGIEIVAKRDEEAPRDPRGTLVVANHRSTIDIALMLQSFGGHIVSRHDIATWPIIGVAATRIGTVFVDRSSVASGAAAVRAMRSLLDAGKTLSVFPEGTTFADDEVHPFNVGAFLAAVQARARIVPVGIAYEASGKASFKNETFLAHLSRMSMTKRTRVAMRIGAPIEIGDARARNVTNVVHERVARLVADARTLIESDTR